MEDTSDALHGNFQRIGRDLRKRRLKSLPDGRRADEDRVVARRLKHNARAFLWSRRAALDEAANGESVITSLDRLAPQLGLLSPADFLHAAVKRRLVVAAVELVLALERRNGGDGIG